jgi:hypothetical protein
VNRSEYERLKLAAKARYERDIEAIERVWSLSGDNKASKPIPPVTPHPDKSEKAQESAGTTEVRNVTPEVVAPPATQSKRERGSVDRAVREAVEKHINGRKFSSTLVSATVKEHFDPSVNRTSISGVLKRLVHSGQLEVVQEGVGRRPTIFRKRQSVN